jgi:hypothetical protein
MKYYLCTVCGSVFVGSDIDQQVFCDGCGDSQHLRSIQRMEYNELVQAKRDGMSFAEYMEWKRHNVLYDDITVFYEGGCKRRVKGADII